MFSAPRISIHDQLSQVSYAGPQTTSIFYLDICFSNVRLVYNVRLMSYHQTDLSKNPSGMHVRFVPLELDISVFQIDRMIYSLQELLQMMISPRSVYLAISLFSLSLFTGRMLVTNTSTTSFLLHLLCLQHPVMFYPQICFKPCPVNFRNEWFLRFLCGVSHDVQLSSESCGSRFKN